MLMLSDRSFSEGNRNIRVTIISPSFMYRTNSMKFMHQLNEFFIIAFSISIIIFLFFFGGGGGGGGERGVLCMGY